MNQKTLISVIVTILILLSLVGYWFVNQNQLVAPVNMSQPSQAPSEETTNTGKQTTFSYKCTAGKSAYELLTETYPDIITKDTAFGKQIIGIAGVKQDEGKFWLYMVNEKEATIGAETYICQDKEDIKWELR